MSQRVEYQTIVANGMKALGGVHQYVVSSGLPRSLVDLVFLRVSQINGCTYCIDMHARDLRKAGVPVEKLMLLSAWREAGALFSDEEQAALQWAESVTLVSQTGVPDADYQAAAAKFGEKDLADLTIAIALINAYNRMAISFRRGPETLPTR